MTATSSTSRCLFIHPEIFNTYFKEDPNRPLQEGETSLWVEPVAEDHRSPEALLASVAPETLEPVLTLNSSRAL